jgi:hypothetical protein
VATAGKILIAVAVLLALIGGLLLLASRLGIDRLPGDVVIRRGSFTLYAPIGLMIVLSAVATIVLNLVIRR